MKSAPRGFTLIEMLAVMSCTAVVITLCVTMIAALMKVDRNLRQEWSERDRLERFARHFRRDVHTSRPDARLVSPRRLELTGPDGNGLVYEIDDGAIRAHRRASADGAERIETFEAASWSADSLAIDEVDGLRIVCLKIRPARRRDGGGLLPLEAVLGGTDPGRASR